MDADAAARSDRNADHSAAAASGDLFAARSGGMADAIGRSFGARRPLFAAVAVWAVAFVVLGAAIIGLGLLLTHYLLPAGLGREDASWSRWFVQERTATLNTVTGMGSDLGSSGVILAVSAITGIALLIGRYWRQFWFLFFALTLEFGLFLITVMIVNRHRPSVVELDTAPPTSSFPSGHTASSLTLYVGLAIVVASLVRQRLLRTIVWVFAVLLPVIVGVSRLYRGMHFPTDVVAGAVLACGALMFSLLAVRSMAAATNERERRASSPPHEVSQAEVRS